MHRKTTLTVAWCTVTWTRGNPTHCSNCGSFSLMTAQLLNDSSSVGHRAACIIWKEIKEKYELQFGINIYRHVDDVDEGYFIVLTKKLGQLKMLMHMLVPLYKQYKSQYCRLLGACFVQLCNSAAQVPVVFPIQYDGLQSLSIWWRHHYRLHTVEFLLTFSKLALLFLPLTYYNVNGQWGFFSLMMGFSKILQFYHVIFHHALHLNISQTHTPLFYWCSALSFQRFQKLQAESC